MKKAKFKIKIVSALCVSVLVLYIMGAFSPLSFGKEIYENVVRLHILANSDSDADQKMKLMVRDEILERFGDEFSDCSNISEAEKKAEELLPEIEKAVNEFLGNNGCDYKASCVFCPEHYPTRNYEGVSLPSGTYRSLQVKIGDADGHNWWCVLFPALCVNSARSREKLVSAGFTDEQIRILTDNDSPKYVLKFKFLEAYDELKEKIIKNVKSKKLS